jgi:hypothetical protein
VVSRPIPRILDNRLLEEIIAFACMRLSGLSFTLDVQAVALAEDVGVDERIGYSLPDWLVLPALTGTITHNRIITIVK